jgi:hypothetical protein
MEKSYMLAKENKAFYLRGHAKKKLNSDPHRPIKTRTCWMTRLDVTI